MALFSFPLAHISAKFILDGITYRANQFSIDTMQDVDFKGQPQHEVQGGQITISITQLADDGLYLWAKKSTLRKSGQIIFQTDLGITVLRINFENAYCNSLITDIDHLVGTTTSLKITPEIINMNGVELNNKW